MDRVRREERRGRRVFVDDNTAKMLRRNRDSQGRVDLDEPKKMYLTDIADLAGMPTTPDTGSDGAEWLERTWRDAVDAVEDGSYPVEEFADSAVPIYTHELWQIWTDCDGFHASSDTMDYFLSSGEAGRDLNKIAQGACYDWAMRLYFSAERLKE